MNLIEGVDYIFDRYAYLGLEPSASTDEIRAAIRGLRASVHEVKLQGLNETLQNNAKHITELADKCASMLLNKDVRPLYDAKLAEFRETNPKLISTNGQAIQMLGTERIDLDDMLQDQSADMETLAKTVRAHCGYSPKQLEKLRALYTADTENETFRDLYRTQLTAMYVFSTVMERQAWAICGISTNGPNHNSMSHPDLHLQRSNEQLASIRNEQLPQLIAQRGNAVAIGMAAPPLLLGYSDTQSVGSAEATQIQQATNETILKAAQSRLDAATEAIRHYSAMRQDALTDIINSTPVFILHRPDMLEDGPRQVFLLLADQPEDDEPTLFATFSFMAKGTHLDNGKIDLAETPTTLSELQAQIYTIPTAAALHHPEVNGFYFEPLQAIERLHAAKPVNSTSKVGLKAD